MLFMCPSCGGTEFHRDVKDVVSIYIDPKSGDVTDDLLNVPVFHHYRYHCTQCGKYVRTFHLKAKRKNKV